MGLSSLVYTSASTVYLPCATRLAKSSLENVWICQTYGRNLSRKLDCFYDILVPRLKGTFEIDIGNLLAQARRCCQELDEAVFDTDFHVCTVGNSLLDGTAGCDEELLASRFQVSNASDGQCLGEVLESLRLGRVWREVDALDNDKIVRMVAVAELER